MVQKSYNFVHTWGYFLYTVVITSYSIHYTKLYEKGISVYAMERLAKNNAFSRNAFTVGASTQLARFLSLSTGYVNTNGDSYLGLGASVRVGCMQLYVSTDNISVMKSFPPGKTSNVSFGLNMLFGRKHQKKGYPKYYEEVTPPEVPVEIPEIPEETTEPEKAIQ